MKKISGLKILAITIVLCVLFAELLLNIVVPIHDPYERWKRDFFEINQYIKSEFPPNTKITTVAENGLPGVSGENTFSINNMGFRGDYLSIPKPFNEFRIFIIGGSTAECLFLDDSQSLNEVLQQHLQKHFNSNILIKVYNAGKSGDASDDHISIIAHRIVHLEPDMIIVFSGINDLIRSLINYDYLHYSINSKRKKPSIIKLFATEFQIFRRVWFLRRKIYRVHRNVFEQITRKSNYSERIEICKSTPYTNERPRVLSKAYKNNLRSITGIAKSNGIHLIFMTQQTTWNSLVDSDVSNWHWMLNFDGKRYGENIMYEAMELFNDAMRQVAIEHFIPIYDTAIKLPKSLEFFYDDVHFNVNGAVKAGKEVGNLIIEADFVRGNN